MKTMQKLAVTSVAICAFAALTGCSGMTQQDKNTASLVLSLIHI